MEVLIGQAPQRAHQRQEQERLVTIAAWAPTGTSRQVRRASLPGQAYGHPAERQQVQSPDQRECIQVQRRCALGLCPMVGWRRDGHRGLTQSRNHRLISYPRVRSAAGRRSAYPNPPVMQCPPFMQSYPVMKRP
jgi:hypothetical protein